jgi:hypothetical protein
VLPITLSGDLVLPAINAALLKRQPMTVMIVGRINLGRICKSYSALYVVYSVVRMERFSVVVDSWKWECTFYGSLKSLGRTRKC